MFNGKSAIVAQFFRVFSISQRTCFAAKITIFFEKKIFEKKKSIAME